MNNVSWKSIGDNKEVKILHDGKLVLIKPAISETPLFCPVCDSAMRTIEDSLSYRLYKCCHYCEIQWATSSFYKWAEGWRPTKEQVVEAVASRSSIKPILFI